MDSIYKNTIKLDKTQLNFDWKRNEFAKHVWSLKYKRRDEVNISQTLDRVVKAIVGNEAPGEVDTIQQLVHAGILLPAGRILAGAGLEEHASTLMNCYVMGKLEDSLDSIMASLHESAVTQKFGGGIGLDFTPIRPQGAVVSTAAFLAGGPIKFAAQWDAMGHALEAGGNRRGGKMMVLEVSHPDIEDFIACKSVAGQLTSFNISVLITDEFIDAVKKDLNWELWHAKPAPWMGTTHEELAQYVRTRIHHDGNMTDVYVWKVVRAKDLWDKILTQTYEHSEPGVIFIDRINATNPINYVEHIRATNPCGEQPLPPYGACDLGSINLARLVKEPFKADAKFDFDLFRTAIRAGVRFLDCVLDATQYPLVAQRTESMAKRRIGLGVTGFADACALMSIPYGSEASVKLAESIGICLADYAYLASAELAHEKGTFPLYNAEKHMQGTFYKSLSPSVRQIVMREGLRNGVLLSIAPTGTISIVFGDVSSGIEPHFSHSTLRRVKVKDDKNNDVWSESITYSYTVWMLALVRGCSTADAYEEIMSRPELYPTAQTLLPAAHVNIQAEFQKHIDASISKTVNCPEDIDFTMFRDVYERAWDDGCKGCTTYRPSETRGAVLVSRDEKTTKVTLQPDEQISVIIHNRKRPDVLYGATYKIKWPAWHSPVYLTVNHDGEGNPFEVFIASKNSQHSEWAVALSVTISKSLQAGISAENIGESLSEITLAQQGAWIEGTYYGSVITRIGEILRKHKERVQLPLPITEDSLAAAAHEVEQLLETALHPETARCTACGSPNLRYSEGCLNCESCGQSNCG